MTNPALWIAFAAMLPLMAYTAWHDVRTLRIPNWIPLTAVGIYVATGIWGLPLETFLWGLAGGAIALVAVFLLYMLLESVGLIGIGGGDLKLFAALVPFMDLRDAAELLLTFTVVMLTTTCVFLIVWRLASGRSDFAALSQEEKRAWKLSSPFGVALALTILIYLGRQVLETF